eukprot:COSAG02_NODE_6743_length_3389_cov_1.334347_4_plen_155_part_00
MHLTKQLQGTWQGLRLTAAWRLQALALDAFEPRYRLMIRRCLDGDRRFGMLGAVQPVPGGTEEFGCEVEIQDSRQLHDGRYHIQVRIFISTRVDLRTHSRGRHKHSYTRIHSIPVAVCRLLLSCLMLCWTCRCELFGGFGSFKSGTWMATQLRG